jgi:hypothetical protein
MSNTPPLLTNRSLELITKVIVIYSLFYTITTVFKAIIESGDPQASIPQAYIVPMYISAILHIVIALCNAWSWKNSRHHWGIAITSGVAIVCSSVFFEDFAIWFATI